MLKPDTIVVGVDHSACSRQALAWAVAEAQRSSRPLLLVHVWHWGGDAIVSPLAPANLPEHGEAGRALLRRCAADIRAQGVEVSTKLLEGPAASALVDAAQGAAMLVVGSHGRNTFANALMGSVSKACVHRSACPVVVVPVHLAEDSAAAAAR